MKRRRVKTVTTINGVRVPEAKARISVFDNSLLYAEGLFETLLACDDRVLFLKEHLDRLYRGASVIDLKPPVSRPRLTSWMKATVRAHPDRVKKLRLTITSGEAARWVGVPGKSQVILSAAPHRLPRRPFKLLVSDWRIDQQSEFRRIKTISFAIHAAALKRAQQKKCDDALMLNQRGKVAEVTTANIFWCRHGKIFTPPLSAGCLEGTTRRLIMREAGKLGFEVIQKSESLERMAEADEVFITSSLKLVTGVSLIAHGRRRYRFGTGAITGALSDRILMLTGL